MSENQPVWIKWAHTLQSWGLNQEAAYLLESTGSLSVLVAQVLYLCQPILSGMVRRGSLDTLANMLENPRDRREFVEVLKRDLHE